MPTVTLAESAKLAQDELIEGVIENIITINAMFDMFPFDGIDGNSLAYNRENVIGAVASFPVGAKIGVSGSGTTKQQAAKNAATFTKVTSSLTTILGDAEVNGLIQATRSSITNQASVQIASKAKAVGREYMRQMIVGDSTIANENEFDGLLRLTPSGQKVSVATDGSPLSFEMLDELLALVLDKDGTAEYIMMNIREINRYMALNRALGGTSAREVMMELPSGRQVPQYRGVPIFRNDFIPVNLTKGGSSNASLIFAGTIDDGSHKHGISGLTAEKAAGLQVVDVGESETADEHIWRVKWYAGLALYSEKGISCVEGVIPPA